METKLKPGSHMSSESPIWTKQLIEIAFCLQSGTLRAVFH